MGDCCDMLSVPQKSAKINKKDMRTLDNTRMNRQSRNRKGGEE